MMAASLYLSGCGKPQKSALEVKKDYVSRFVEGFEFGESGMMKAASFDPETLDLIDLAVTDNAGNMFNVKRAEVMVDAAADTVSLRLNGITGASTASGELWSESQLIIPPEKVDYDIR